MHFKPSHRFIILVSFISIYLVWGSTYLAIRYAIETLPTWGLAATRFMIAGAIMLLLSRVSREPKLSRTEMNSAVTTGGIFMTANAIVCLVERWIPSGIVAVAIGAMPIWVMLVGRAAFNQPAPSARKWIGALLGLAGISIIAFNRSNGELTGTGKYAIFILFFSSLMWATGTHLQRKVSNISAPFRYSGWQMLFGGAAVSVISFASGELNHFPWSEVSAVSLWAWAYLIVFGSVVAFTAYSWLGRNVEPHVLSSYALVNPVIAVVLGWLLANEAITPQFLIATALVCVGLVLLLITPRKKIALPSTLEILKSAKAESIKTSQQSRVQA